MSERDFYWLMFMANWKLKDSAEEFSYWSDLWHEQLRKEYS